MSYTDKPAKLLTKTHEDLLKETETCEVCKFMSKQGKFCSKHFRQLMERQITDLRSLQTWSIIDTSSTKEARKQ